MTDESTNDLAVVIEEAFDAIAEGADCTLEEAIPDVAERISAAGWVSPEEHRLHQASLGDAMREARRAYERAEKAEAKRNALRGLLADAGYECSHLDHTGDAETECLREQIAQGNADVVALLAKVGRVEALAKQWTDDNRWLAAKRLRDALAEPERDEEGGR